MIDRICKKCKIKKSIGEFHNKESGRRGRNCICKKCMNKWNRNNYQKTKKKVIAYQILYQRNMRLTEQGRLKYNAYQRLNWNIKHGNIIRLPCQVCEDKNTYAHHYFGYNPKNALKVKWLCRKHHIKEHYPKA